MKRLQLLAAVAAAMLGSTAVTGAVQAQEAVTPAADIDALFTSPNPKQQVNKQAAYHIMKDLLEANHWELAGKYLTDRYVQHNPNAASGLAGVVYYFTQVRKTTPTPIPAKLSTPVVSVTAEGDLVIVSRVRVLKDPKDATKTYTTTWFDMWRFKDGKADEHWDGAEKP